MKSLVIVRTMMSIPRVTMATANNASPIIGRRNIRSSAIPIRAASTRANTTERTHCSHTGDPSIHLPGTLMIVANDAIRKAPIADRAPWAKLRT